MQTPIKIVLTGGPGAGKTTSLSYLYDKLSDLGFRVIMIPEAARMVLSSGIKHNQYDNPVIFRVPRGNT